MNIVGVNTLRIRAKYNDHIPRQAAWKRTPSAPRMVLPPWGVVNRAGNLISQTL
jgi:hypothetical protein